MTEELTVTNDNSIVDDLIQDLEKLSSQNPPSRRYQRCPPKGKKRAASPSQVVKALGRGISKAKVAEKFGICTKTVERYVRWYEEKLAELE